MLVIRKIRLNFSVLTVFFQKNQAVLIQTNPRLCTRLRLFSLLWKNFMLNLWTVRIPLECRNTTHFWFPMCQSYLPRSATEVCKASQQHFMLVVTHYSRETSSLLNFCGKAWIFKHVKSHFFSPWVSYRFLQKCWELKLSAACIFWNLRADQLNLCSDERLLATPEHCWNRRNSAGMIFGNASSNKYLISDDQLDFNIHNESVAKNYRNTLNAYILHRKHLLNTYSSPRNLGSTSFSTEYLHIVQKMKKIPTHVLTLQKNEAFHQLSKWSTWSNVKWLQLRLIASFLWNIQRS